VSNLIGRLLRRSRRLGRPLAAPIGDRLQLVRGGSSSPPEGAGRLRASASFGGSPIAIWELDEEQGGGMPRVVDLESFIADIASPLDVGERAELFEFVRSTVTPDLERQGHFTLARSLLLLRKQLREPLPALAFDPSASQTVFIDSILAVDERSFWFTGWCRDEDGTLTTLELISPEGQRAELLKGAYRFARGDVEETLAAAGIYSREKHGFVKLIELPERSPLNEGWLGEVRRPSGAGFEIVAPAVVRDTAVARERILTELAIERPDVNDLRREHGYPALSRLQAQVRRAIEVESAVEHGDPPQSPEVSIVIPLYGRVDLVEHQIAQFWHDPEIGASELIYVLDSPELAEHLAQLVSGLHALYGIPIKVLTLNRNAGYSTANNIGASHARGRLLLLLNSDVLPAQPGWLGRLRGFYDATPGIGALGPKLLFEDDSIQHAGMYFQRAERRQLWENQHYYKGFNRSLAGANVTQPVPAVTGACLMIERALYEEMGGLRDIFVQGGYEDSDLCLRLLEAGRRNWYAADVELYHLEAQSLPIHARLANRYNLWLQTHLWNDRIEEVMRAQREATEPHVALID
jgi:GT2 family glycosyltransferase